MDTLIVTLNSKYIHSNLAIRYLKRFVEDIEDVGILEFTINQNIDFIASEIYKQEKELVVFSVYIWNIKETLKICKILKTVKPELKIALGGPEVSYDIKQHMESYEYIDFIMFGEGEETFREFILENQKTEKDYKGIDGLAFRNEGEAVVNSPRKLMEDLNIIPSPYEEKTDEFKNKIVYYESSRGCPFGCKFCLSSTIRGVRYFDIDRVKRDLKNLIDMGVRQVKFVDRTFNANKKYSREIMEFLIKEDPEGVNFHFEVTAHLIDKETLNFLETVKEGLFQFEIGVQSTNPKTIEAVGRTTDFERLSRVVRRIKSFKNIHQHLDLIAGLPYEGIESFKKSFDDVYNLEPEKLQLGFLKLLKGSELRLLQENYGYKYIDEPPYEVLESNYIDYGGILKLKDIEEMVDRYYNDGNFKNTIKFLVKNHYGSPYNFYDDFSKFWNENGYHKVSHSKRTLYKILYNFIKRRSFEYIELIYDLLKYDYIYNNKNRNLPFKIEGQTEERFNIHDVLKDNRILDNYLERYKDTPTKRVINKVNVVGFSFNVLEVIRKNFNPMEEEDTYVLFDYKDGSIIKCETNNITSIVGSVSN